MVSPLYAKMIEHKTKNVIIRLSHNEIKLNVTDSTSMELKCFVSIVCASVGVCWKNYNKNERMITYNVP